MSRYTLILIYLLLVSPPLAICQEGPQRPRVVATASMIADMAQTIAGDLLTVECIVPIGGDPHLHEPTPQDARMVSEADLILINGLTFEGWLGKLISNSGTSASVDTVTKGIEPIRSQTYQNAVDPHAWMDASNGQVYIRNITEALVRLDPQNEDIYRFNYGVYRDQLEALDRYITEQISTIPESKRVLITSHDAFHYYGKRYGLQLESLLGTSTDAEIQTGDIMRISQVIREQKIPAIFTESTINPKVLEQLASDQRVVIGGKLYSDSIGHEDSEAPTYLDMLRYNTDTIVKALTMPWEEKDPSSGLPLGWLLFPAIALVAIVAALIWRKKH